MVKRRRSILTRERILGAILICGACAGALAFAAGVGIDNFSQVAVGAAADAMCMGGADAKCPCKTGFKKGTKQCDGKTKGDGKIGCPCKDITSGDEAASGKCATVGKCKADKADGMPPMLPMLPMPMPKMMMPMMMPQPCVPKTATTTATTTAINPARTAIDTSGISNPDCPPISQGGGGGSWNPFGSFSNPFASPDDYGSGEEETTSGGAGGVGGTSGSTSVWSKLMESLGLGSGASGGGDDTDEDNIDYTGTSTTQVKSKAKNTNASTTGGTDTSDDFTYGKAGSTFSYSEDTIDEEAVSSVLDEIAKILKKLLDIVNSWLKR